MSTQSFDSCKRARISHSMGVWLTTFKSCLWLHTSHSIGAMLKSPVRMVGLSSSVEDHWIMRSRKSSFCPNFGLTRSEEHTSELQSLMRISYAVFCLKKKTLHN